MRIFATSLAALLLLTTVAEAKGVKTQHVRSYTTKRGTHVSSYRRSHK